MDLADQMRPALTAREIPSLLSAAANLRHPPDKAWVVRVLSCAHHCMGDFTIRGLAVMVWSIGRMGMRLRPDFARRFLSAFAKRMGGEDGSSAREVARALALAVHGLGNAGCKPSGAWMGRWLAAVQSRGRALAPRDVVCLLAGLQKMR